MAVRRFRSGVVVPGPVVVGAVVSALIAGGLAAATGADAAPVDPQPTASAGLGLIRNGSFEQPQLPAGTYGFVDHIRGWTSDGPPIEVQNGVLGPARAGQQYLELDSDDPYAISQTITPTVSGVYTLVLGYAGRPGLGPDDNVARVTVAGGGATAVDAIVTVDATSDSTAQWRRRATPVTVTAGEPFTVTLAGEGLDDGLGMLVDLVQLYPTP